MILSRNTIHTNSSRSQGVIKEGIVCQNPEMTHGTNRKKRDFLTPSNQVVIFHSHAVSAEHTNDHDIKMKSFYTHPRESC